MNLVQDKHDDTVDISDVKPFVLAKCVTSKVGCCGLVSFTLLYLVIFLLIIYVPENTMCLSFNFGDFKVEGSEISSNVYMKNIASHTSYRELYIDTKDNVRRRRIMSDESNEYIYKTIWTKNDYRYREWAQIYLEVFYYSKKTSNILTNELLDYVHTIEQGIKSWPSYHNHSLLTKVKCPQAECSSDTIYIESPPGSLITFLYPQIYDGYYIYDGDGDTICCDIKSTLRQYVDSNDKDVDITTDFFDFDFNLINVSSKYLASVYPFGYINQNETQQELENFILSFTDYFDNSISPHINQYIGLSYTDSHGAILDNQLFDYLYNDLNYAIISLLLTFIVGYCYIRSLFLTFTGLIGVISAFIPCFAAIKIFYGDSFNIIGLVSIWIILGIGCDDIFVFISSYRRSSIHLSDLKRMSFAYREAGSAMLVTSVTTAFSFYSLCFSKISPLPEFGFFTGTLVILNFILVMTWFPCMLTVYIWIVRCLNKRNYNLFNLCKRLHPIPIKSENIDKKSINHLVFDHSDDENDVNNNKNKNKNKNKNNKIKHKWSKCTKIYFIIMKNFNIGIILIFAVFILSCYFGYYSSNVSIANQNITLLPSYTNWGKLQIATNHIDIDRHYYVGGPGDGTGTKGNIIVNNTPNPSKSPTPPTTPRPTHKPTPPTQPTTHYPSKSPVPPTTKRPTHKPTSATNDPTNKPTNIPTNIPSTIPTPVPSVSPSNNPTTYPTRYPSNIPTINPTTENPTTNIPTSAPITITDTPTETPVTKSPTNPTDAPITKSPTNPTIAPVTRSPTNPTNTPVTKEPTSSPTFNPSITSPTPSPLVITTTLFPSTNIPSNVPSRDPTTSIPTIAPTFQPSTLKREPSISPTQEPTIEPTITMNPTQIPTYSYPIHSIFKCGNELTTLQEVRTGDTFWCKIELYDNNEALTFLNPENIAIIFNGAGVYDIEGCSTFNTDSQYYNPNSNSNTVKWCYIDNIYWNQTVSNYIFNYISSSYIPSPSWFSISSMIYYNETWHTVGIKYNFTVCHVYSDINTEKVSISDSITILLIFGIQSITDYTVTCNNEERDGIITFDNKFDIYNPLTQKRAIDLCNSLEELGKNDEIMYRMDDQQELCLMKQFKEWLNISANIGWPLTNQTIFNELITKYINHAGFTRWIGFIDNEYSSYYGWDPNKTRIQWIYQVVETEIDSGWSAKKIYKYYKKWDNWMNKFNSDSADSTDKFIGFQTSNAYVYMEVEIAFLNGFIKSVGYTIIVCCIVMIIFTRNIVLSFIVCLYIILIVIWVLGIFASFNWEFGIIEIITIPTVIGLTIDYALHLLHAYQHSFYNFQDRVNRTKSAINNLGSSICASALTTIASMFLLYFATISVFSDLGFLVSITTTFGLCLAILICPPLLMYIGPQNDTCQLSWLYKILCHCKYIKNRNKNNNRDIELVGVDDQVVQNYIQVENITQTNTQLL